jgi:probable HAF family extracellular repeat protein
LPAGSGWQLWAATGINNAGQIVGYGLDPQGYEHAFLMTPTTTVASPATVSSFSVTASSSSTTAGIAETVTVKALGTSGQVVTGYTGTIHFTSSDGQAVLPANYTFTSADKGVHTFSVTLKTAGTESITATDTSSGLAGKVQVTVSPAAAASLTLTGYPSPTTAGVAHSFTVKALDAYGNVATGYRGTVSFTSSDSKAGLPANYTFTATDSGAHTFSATLKTAGSRSIVAADTTTSTVKGSTTVTVAPAAAASLTLTGYPSSTTAGAAHSFTLTALDAYGNVATGYRGAVSFTSSDAKAVLPASYTFVAADSGAHTFSATLNTVGTESLTATDKTNALTGSESNIKVNAASTAPYTILDLGALGGTLSEANAINVSGVVAGLSTLASGNETATMYSGALHNLGTLGGSYSDAMGINALNQVVGQATTSGDLTAHAFLYNGSMHDLGTLGGDDSQANAINQAGQIVGSAETSGDFYTHAFLYSNGSMKDLGTLGGQNSQANAINNNGQITGDAYDAKGKCEAFLYSGSTMTELGTLGGSLSDGFGINLSGQIVGVSTTAGDAAEVAFLYSGGRMTSLGTLGGTNSQAYAINDSGTIVGQAAVNAYQSDAFIYSNGKMTDLNSLLPAGSGWQLWAATGINNAGQIVGYGLDPQGYEHAFLMTPTTTTTASTSSVTASSLSSTAQTLVVTQDSNSAASPVAAAKLVVSGFPLSTTAGMAQSFTVTALDGSGNVDAGYRGTVSFSSSDPRAVLPARYTFTSADHGVHAFTVTLNTPGTQWLKVMDAADSVLAGLESGIQVRA